MQKENHFNANSKDRILKWANDYTLTNNLSYEKEMVEVLDRMVQTSRLSDVMDTIRLIERVGEEGVMEADKVMEEDEVTT